MECKAEQVTYLLGTAGDLAPIKLQVFGRRRLEARVRNPSTAMDAS